VQQEGEFASFGEVQRGVFRYVRRLPVVTCFVKQTDVS
jgi:hypothetical protein